MASEHHSWFKSALPEQHAALSKWIKGQAINGDEFTQPMADIASSSVFSSWVVSIVLILLAFLGRASLQKAMSKSDELSRYEADSGFGLRNMFEVYVGFIYDLAATNIGKKDAKKFFWLVGGLFIYILFNNLVGTMPYGVPATQSISNNFSMAIVVLVFFVGIGIIRTGSGFFKHMAGPIWWIAPLIFAIEAFGTFIVRPLTLSIRLTGNINGDHKVMEVAYTLFEYILPSVTLVLGTFVSFIQAFVFTILTIVYIALSVEHHDDHH
jgi:F-type H+-transporting ATPase subunit a